MANDKPHISVIILNWNGWQDTIECLESVFKLDYETFNVILIDNHSSDDSLYQIRNWVSGTADVPINTKFPELIYPLHPKPINFIELTDGDFSGSDSILRNRDLVLIKNSANLGFAVANNQAMVLSEKLFQSKYYFLLNNDTVIEKDALTDLVERMEEDDTISAAQSTIFSYEDNKKIASAGGRVLFWGQTKYYKQIDTNEVKNISFISGCAFFIKAEVIRTHGYLTELFFHGEEDFEFSMRSKKKHLKIICSGGSRVYHKAGSSVKKLLRDYERTVLLFALNRTVNLKYYYPWLIWYFWRIAALLYFIHLLWLRYKVPLKRSIYLMKNVYKYSGFLTNVNKQTMEKIFREMKLR
jgi:GT2 family glycosyltransferase